MKMLAVIMVGCVLQTAVFLLMHYWLEQRHRFVIIDILYQMKTKIHRDLPLRDINKLNMLIYALYKLYVEIQCKILLMIEIILNYILCYLVYIDKTIDHSPFTLVINAVDYIIFVYYIALIGFSAVIIYIINIRLF